MPRRLDARPKRERLAAPDWQLVEDGQDIWPEHHVLGLDELRVQEALDEMRAHPRLDPMGVVYADVIRLRFYGRLTLQAIAEEMGWRDRRWTSTYLRRALDRLTRALG